MSNDMNYTAIAIAGESISVTLGGETVTIASDAANYADLLAAIRRRAPGAEVKKLLTPVAMFTAHAADSGFEIRASKTGSHGVFFNGSEVHNAVAKMIIDLFLAGDEIAPLKNFLMKAMTCKSEGRIDVLYDFISTEKLPLHPDGDFFAFKAVRKDGRDQHSGKVLYQIGKYVEAKDFNPSEYVQCGKGLHIGGRNYVQRFGREDGRYFVVKVDPADAIFFTNGEGKMRVKKMFVYAETVGGAELQNSLAFNITMSPEGDLLEKAADNRREKKLALRAEREKLAGVIATKPEPLQLTDQRAEKLKKTRKKPTKVERKARKKVASAKKVQTFTAKAKKGAKIERLFTTKGNQTFTEGEIIAGVKEHGQRGFAARAGLSRTTIQEWIKVINGIEARKR